MNLVTVNEITMNLAVKEAGQVSELNGIPTLPRVHRQFRSATIHVIRDQTILFYLNLQLHKEVETNAEFLGDR